MSQHSLPPEAKPKRRDTRDRRLYMRDYYDRVGRERYGHKKREKQREPIAPDMPPA